jgi:hypothetical protein
MAMEKFRAAPIPQPPNEYDPRYIRQVLRVLELYFDQLDSLTPQQANSYRADNFYGGNFNGDFQGGDVNADTVTADLLTTRIAQIQEAVVKRLYADYAEIKALYNPQFVGGSVMGNTFYGGNFFGEGYGLKLPHIAASDSTDQIAGGNDTATVVNWNTLDSGYEWTLSPPGSAAPDFPGVYKITYSLQFINTANAAHDATVWLKVNTSDLANSSTKFSIPGRKSATEFSYVTAYSEVTFEADAGDVIELYWATDLAGNPTTPTDGVYIFHDAAQVSPFARPAIPSAIGSITFVSALNQNKVAPLPAFGFGEVGQVTVVTT